MGSALDLALPTTCGGCGREGTAWCRLCAADLALWPVARPVRPTPCPPGFPPSWAVTPYAGCVRHALAAYKDDGRRDLAAVLAPVLALALRAALAQACRDAPGVRATGVLVVPVPSSAAARRRRGDAPLERLTRCAAALPSAPNARPAPPATPAVPSGVPSVGPGAVPCAWVHAGVLRPARRTVDQAGLSYSARAANLAGAFAASPAVAGRVVIVVDDVVTTGATLGDAARALRDAGARRVLAACIAATQRRGSAIV